MAQQITKRAVCKMVVHNAKIANVDYTLHFPDGKRVITLLEKTERSFHTVRLSERAVERLFQKSALLEASGS